MGRFVQLCLCVVWLHYMIFCALSAAVCKLLTVVGDRFRVLVPSCTGHRSTYFVFDHGESIRFHKIGQNTLASPCTDQWAKSVEVAFVFCKVCAWCRPCIGTTYRSAGKRSKPGRSDHNLE